MIKLPVPKYDVEKIVNDCISSWGLTASTKARKKRVEASLDEIVEESNRYMQRATAGELSLFRAHEELTHGATKEDMIRLYEDKFVSGGGRKYYEGIRGSASKCPYCRKREVTTIDHYLSKTKYPVFSVAPGNLVPSCSDCNKIKDNIEFTSRDEEVIHPYFDDFTQEKWISAQVIPNGEEPIAFAYKVSCPDAWDKTRKTRALNHFDVFKLARVYAFEASEELVTCLSRIKRDYSSGGEEQAKKALREDISALDSENLNSWRSAMYQAILDDDWFWDEYIKTC